MKSILAVLLFAAASVAASPTISSVSPNSGPVEGGTVVTIKGSGFHACLFCNPPVPPMIVIGGIITPVTIVDESTLRFVTPPHLPDSVSVTVGQDDGHAFVPNAFTYTGTVESAFERILLPLFSGPLIGAFDSLFITHLRLANLSSVGTVPVFGVQPHCAIPDCIPFELLELPYLIPATVSLDPLKFDYTGKPGAFLYVPKGAQLGANLRVYDDTRSAFNFGTEIPVVREREFTTAPIRLLGVPRDSRFRNTLRIYATAETSVTVTYTGFNQQVLLRAGENLFDPAYAQFTDFPTGTGTFDVTITPSTVTPPMPGLTPPAVWAFISVTNNDTQLISTITPN